MSSILISSGWEALSFTGVIGVTVSMILDSDVERDSGTVVEDIGTDADVVVGVVAAAEEGSDMGAGLEIVVGVGFVGVHGAVIVAVTAGGGILSCRRS